LPWQAAQSIVAGVSVDPSSRVIQPKTKRNAARCMQHGSPATAVGQVQVSAVTRWS